MTLHLKYNSDSQTLKSGFIAHGRLYDSSTAARFIVSECDHWLWAFGSHRWFAPGFARSVREMHGFIRGSSSDVDLVVSNRPRSYPYEESHEDFQTYGSFFHNLRIFGSVLSGQNVNPPSYKAEHFCRHETYSGEMIAVSDELPTVLISTDFFGTSVPCRSTTGLTYQGSKVLGLNPLTVDPYVNYSDFDTRNIVDMLQGLLGKTIEHTFLFAGGIWVSTLSDLSYSLSHERLVFDYRVVVHELLYDQHYDWRSRFVVEFVCPPPTLDPAVGFDFFIPTTSHVKYSCNMSLGIPWPQEDFSLDGFITIQPCFFTVPPADVPDEALNLGIVRISLADDSRFLQRFVNSINSDYLHVVPSSCFSAVDAFKQAEGSLNTNVLQDLQKLPDIASALPKIKEAVSILGKLRKRQLGLATLREILDLATSTDLQANFQWRPYIGLLQEYIPRLGSTFNAIGDISGVVVGRGSYSKKLSQAFGREDVTLHTRSKIVMDASPSGLLSATLRLDALGLVPKPSNLWDLLPFSFVANWFTGVGESIRRAEYSLLLATIPAYFVHTYTISSPFTDKELDQLGTSDSGPEPAGLRVYYRDVSLYSPYPRDSKFGFGIPSSLPPLGTMGSLLYQLIFG